MGYFDGLASGIIKKDKDNNPLYYPWGVLGKGYVLPSVERETEIKNMVILFYQLFFGVFFVYLFLLINTLIFALLVLALVIWFLVKSKQLTKDCPKSSEKLTLKEGYTNSAKAHNLWALYILLVAGMLFTLIGLLLLVSGKSVGTALFIVVLFGACTATIGYMIRVKKTTNLKKQTKTPAGLYPSSNVLCWLIKSL